MAKKIQNNIKSTLSTDLKDYNIVPKEQALSYAIPFLTKLYADVNPNITTINSNNIIYFNTNAEYDDNAYCAQLISMSKNYSATHTNMLNLKKNMLIGDGLVPANPNDPNAQATIDFLNQENTYGESLQHIWSKLCSDYSIFEAYVLELIYNGNGQIVECVHHSPDLVRAVANPINPEIPYIDMWQISYYWARIANKNFRRYQVSTHGIPIPNFDPKTWAEDGARQLIYVKQYTAGNNPYAIPMYQSALPYIQLDEAIGVFNLNSVVRGFTPSAIISLVGNPSPEEKEKFVNKFKQRYSSQYGEKILFIWTTNADEKPTIIPFDANDNSSMIKLLNEIIIEKIANSHGANLELAGIQTTNNMSLGGDANRLAVSYGYYYQTVIQPMQKVMLEGINRILKVNGLQPVTVITSSLKVENPADQVAPTPTAVENNNNKQSIIN